MSSLLSLPRRSVLAFVVVGCAPQPTAPRPVAVASSTLVASSLPSPSAPPLASSSMPVAGAPPPPTVSLGTFVRSLDAPIRSLALGEPRVAALGDEPWLFENGGWKKLALSDRVREKAGEHHDGRIFFGRDDRPRIMGTRMRAEGASQLYLRFRNGSWNEERGEIAKLGDPPAGGMFGVLGHADPEVVCKISDDCIVKRRTGWKMMRAGAGSPRVELHAGVAWAIHPDGVARLDDDHVWSALRPPEPLEAPGGVWGLAGEVWISEPSAARLRHFVDGAWSKVDAPFSAPRAMWGASRDDVWLAGATGLAHYDGARWSLVAGPTGPLSEVYGRGSEIWAAGESGVWSRVGGNEAK